MSVLTFPISIQKPTNYCQCPNQSFLLTPGTVCELCGQMVPEAETDTNLNESKFDAAYFEALEESHLPPDLAA